MAWYEVEAIFGLVDEFVELAKWSVDKMAPNVVGIAVTPGCVDAE
jgi:hypothetical protein